MYRAILCILVSIADLHSKLTENLARLLTVKIYAYAHIHNVLCVNRIQSHMVWSAALMEAYRGEVITAWRNSYSATATLALLVDFWGFKDTSWP